MLTDCAWQSPFCCSFCLFESCYCANPDYPQSRTAAAPYHPSQTGIGDGFAVAVFPDFLAAGLNIALNHEALYQIPYISGVTAAVEHFFGNANLFLILLVRVGVVCVHDTGRIPAVPACYTGQIKASSLRSGSWGCTGPSCSRLRAGWCGSADCRGTVLQSRGR